ncbi:hypothetical protein BT96DRAFT_888853 [Gymnopus androsaceus JB14]|uniref:Xylanolytic transcriptional activator regulatory domain-containing protein n=1 Tax=Gymnopus androsaceus JB14 TaxID=1447944 RepID=A0A6A4GYV7_9AGAR|nr:hypothetical protein BT96DRAFT_888853 [Gymnopus androsaceus JB14]
MRLLQPGDSSTRPGNTCTNCLKESIECTHTVQKKKRGPRRGTASGMGSSSLRSIINDVIAEPDTYSVPEDPNAVRKIILDLAHYTRSLERQVSRWRQAATQLELSTITMESDASSDGEDSDSDSSRADTVEVGLTGTLRDLTLRNDDSNNTYQRHFGKSSNMMMMKTAVMIKEEILGERLHADSASRRMEFWTSHPWERVPKHLHRPLTFPEDDLLRSLCDLYFIHVHPYIPLMYQVQFEKAISDGLHLQDRKFGLVVLGVCAVASKFSDDPRNLVDGTSNEHSLGWRWYEQTSFLRGSFLEPPSLYDLQCCCLSALYLMGTSVSDSMWVIVGLGIRLAKDMGLHRKKKRRPGLERPSAKRTVQSELCTRVFWVLLNFDIILSIAFGRPRATTSDDFDLELPIECDEIYWETEDPEKAFVQPPGVPSRLSFFIFHCKLLEIAGFAQRALFSVNRSKFWKKIGNETSNWEQKAVIELDSALNEWFSSVPEHLKWDPNGENNIFFRQSSILQTVFYWAQLQVHGLFVHARPGQSNSILRQPSNSPSLVICCNAARCCIKILDIQHRLHMRHHIIFLAPVFSCAIILYLQAARRRQFTDVSKDLQDVYRCLQIISFYDKRYQSAGRLYDVLSSMLSLGDYQRFQHSKNGQGLFNATPESQQHEHSGSGETAPT